MHVWKLYQHVGVLDNFKSPVTALSHCKEGLAIATAKGNVYVYDFQLKTMLALIDFMKMKVYLLNYLILSLDFNGKKLIALTNSGEAVEINVHSKKAKKAKIAKVVGIGKVNGNMKALCLLNQIDSLVMFGGD